MYSSSSPQLTRGQLLVSGLISADRQTALCRLQVVDKGHDSDEELMILFCFSTTFCLCENYFILIPPTEGVVCLASVAANSSAAQLERQRHLFVSKSVDSWISSPFICLCAYDVFTSSQLVLFVSKMFILTKKHLSYLSNFRRSTSKLLHNHTFILVSSVQWVYSQCSLICLCQTKVVFMSISWMCLLFIQFCTILYKRLSLCIHTEHIYSQINLNSQDCQCKQ